MDGEGGVRDFGFARLLNFKKAPQFAKFDPQSRSNPSLPRLLRRTYSSRGRAWLQPCRPGANSIHAPQGADVRRLYHRLLLLDRRRIR
jgi:hypothetical protein